jgi:hypothetical protein
MNASKAASASYEAVRPSPAYRYFRLRDFRRLCFFPWHCWQGSHVDARLYYQFRVTSTKTQGGAGATTCELSRTEDLRGVFYVS